MTMNPPADRDGAQPGAGPTLGIFLAACLAAGAAGALYLTADAAGPGHAARGYPLDDAWIHQVYARSIAGGTPFEYNPGERETGSTSPLWAVLLAPAHWFMAGPVPFTKGLGILLTAAAGAVGYRIGARLGRPGAGAVFALLLPSLPYVSFAAVSGTEVPLTLLLVLAALERALAGRWTATGVVTGLAILARPENLLLLPLIAAAAYFQQRRTGSARARPMIQALLPPALMVLPWVAFCLWTTGRPLPATFYAKASWFGLANPAQITKVAGVILWQPFLGSTLGSPWVVVGAALGLGAVGAGSVALLRRGAAGSWPGVAFPWLFLWAQSAGLPLGPVADVGFPGSVRTFYFARYFLPALAPLLLAWSLGIAALLSWRPAAGAGARRVAARLAGTVCVVLAAIGAIHQHVLLRDIYSWNCRNIEEMNVAAGRWVAEHLPHDAVVGVSDAGALRYFGGRRIIDLVGLNSQRLIRLHQEVEALPPWSTRAAQLREAFWSQEHPTHLAVTPEWHRVLLHGRRLRLLHTLEMERNTIFGGERMVGGPARCGDVGTLPLKIGAGPRGSPYPPASPGGRMFPRCAAAPADGGSVRPGTPRAAA